MNAQIKRIHTILITLAALVAVTTFQVSALAGVGQPALVTDNNVDLRYQPNLNARSKARLYAGRPVRVNEMVDGWVRVSFEIEHGRDVIAMEGWLPLDSVRAAKGKTIRVTSDESATTTSDDSSDWTKDLDWSE